MSYLIGTIVALVLGLYYSITKNKSLKVLLDASRESTAYNKADQDISKNQGLLATEEQNRKQIQTDLETKEKDVAKEDILSYFNSNHSD